MAAICSNRSILIIDDDARMLKALEKVLTQAGAMVMCAELATDAFRILADRHGKFDLVITDLRMPIMSGDRAISVIHEILPELPIIVLTAFGGPEIEAECARQGAMAFLEKPLDTVHLLEVISTILDPEQVSGVSRRIG